LVKIDASNVSRLGFAWAYDLGTARGQEATPLVIDCIMYTSGTWGYVYAIDVTTGKELWKFDPGADPRAARKESQLVDTAASKMENCKPLR
jgi:quinohemoprotein ethanol dehydrogenase